MATTNRSQMERFHIKRKLKLHKYIKYVYIFIYLFFFNEKDNTNVNVEIEKIYLSMYILQSARMQISETWFWPGR